MIHGGDLISLLFSMGLLRKRQEVLFYSESSEEGRWQNIHSWGELELRHLELLGEKIESDALSKVRDYVRPLEVVYSIGDKRLKLTADPWENFFNIYRKFPQWFDLAKRPQFNPRKLLEPTFKEKFNTEFLRGLNRVAENCFRYRQLENLTAALFETHLPDFILHCAESLTQLFRQETVENVAAAPLSLEERKFLLGIRFFMQQHLDLKWGKVEIYHFLISLLAPRYELNEKELLSALNKEFHRFGGFWVDSNKSQDLGESTTALSFENGHILKTPNQNFKANYCVSFINSMTAVKRPSFVSTLNFSSVTSGHLIQIKTRLSLDECDCRFNLNFKDLQWHFHVEPELLGGDLALWLFLPNLKEGVLEVITWVRDAECLDPHYFSKRALEILQDIGVFKAQSNPTQIDFIKTGGVGYLHQFQPKALHFELHLPQRLPFYSNTSPQLTKIKDGVYLGKRRGSLMGTFGSLLEIKDVTYWAERKQ